MLGSSRDRRVERRKKPRRHVQSRTVSAGEPRDGLCRGFRPDQGAWLRPSPNFSDASSMSRPFTRVRTRDMCHGSRIAGRHLVDYSALTR